LTAHFTVRCDVALPLVPVAVSVTSQEPAAKVCDTGLPISLLPSPKVQP